MNWNQNRQYGFASGGNFCTPNVNYNVAPPSQQQYYTPQSYQMPTQPSMSGRVIQNINEVMPNDVKMDGSYSFFPVQDGSAIYVMRWSQDGSRIEQMRYIPEQQNISPETKSFEQVVVDRFDALEEMIRNQNRYHHSKKPFKNKEDNSNESVNTENNEPNGSK